MRVKSLFAAAALTATFAFPVIAHAGERDAISVEVRYADLDLSHQAGVDAMINRIERAAQTACQARGGRAPISAWRAERACVRETATNAVHALNEPRVSTRYAERMGERARFAQRVDAPNG